MPPEKRFAHATEVIEDLELNPDVSDGEKQEGDEAAGVVKVAQIKIMTNGDAALEKIMEVSNLGDQSEGMKLSQN